MAALRWTHPLNLKLRGFHMTTVVCVHLCVCVRMEGKGLGWGGSVHSDEARSQCLLFTDGPFTGPGLPPAPPSQFSSIPYRIPLSGASGMGREGGRGIGVEGVGARLSTTNVFFRNRLLLVWLPMKTTPAFAVWTNCPVLSSGADGPVLRSKGPAAQRDVCVTRTPFHYITLHPCTAAINKSLADQHSRGVLKVHNKIFLDWSWHLCWYLKFVLLRAKRPINGRKRVWNRFEST